MFIADGGRKAYNDTHALDRCHHHLVGGVVVSGTPMEEVWKPIDGYEGLYEVSNLGRVRSLEFRNNQTSFKRKKIMSATDNGHGYLIVCLRRGGHKRSSRYVHRLVAQAFIPNPDNLPVIDHIDHDRSNNVVTNLQWLTQKDNIGRSRHLMSKPRKKVTSNTGQKYITRVKSGEYKVSLPWKRYWKQFKTLEQAKEARDCELKKTELVQRAV